MSLLLPKPTKADRTRQTRARNAFIRALDKARGLVRWGGDVKRLDALFALIVKERDGWKCRLCRSTYRPQCAHLISRRYKGVRWNLDNAWTLCARCHKRYTEDPLAWESLMEAIHGKLQWERRRVLARIPTKLDLSMVELRLRREAADHGVSGMNVALALGEQWPPA